MIELELTFLARVLPDGLANCPHKKIVDLYIDNGTDHCDLRVRKNGDKYELTRKTPVEDGDASKQTEQTISLNATEFESFAGVRAKSVSKVRYYYEYEGHTAEFDIFTDRLSGLVVVDFEFTTETDKDAFVMPDFCLADITQETFIAGGVLAGNSYKDVIAELDRFSYQPLMLDHAEK